MALEHHEIVELKNEIFAEADEKYVRIEDCNDKQTKNNKRFAEDDKRIAIIMHDFKIIKWILTALAGASGGSLITAIIELFSK